MSELVNELRGEIEQFLDSERQDLSRVFKRKTVVHARGVDIPITQFKTLNQSELPMLLMEGTPAVPSNDWFDDVEMIRRPDERTIRPNGLHLEAVYPLEYFDEAPRGGTFRGNNWLESYGTIHGFGSKPADYTWRLDFVEEGAGSLTRLYYPEDPTAVDRYNARYRRYLDTLDTSDASIEYECGWDKWVSLGSSEPRLYLGGLTLLGFSSNKLLHPSESASDVCDDVTVVLRNETDRNGYMGQLLTLTAAGAIIGHFGDAEEYEEPASDALLATSLQLVRDATHAS